MYLNTFALCSGTRTHAQQVSKSKLNATAFTMAIRGILIIVKYFLCFTLSKGFKNFEVN